LEGWGLDLKFVLNPPPDLRITPLSYDSKGCKKQYKLLPEIVHVPISTLVQEHMSLSGSMRGGVVDGESTLKEVCHAALMQHNYSRMSNDCDCAF
jgi:hypothetical protein